MSTASEAPAAMPYFTDASVLADPAAARVFILGPGDPAQPHTANESCPVDAIVQAVAIYTDLLSAIPR